ncbi:MAG: hypothetical protein HY895_06920, partial [Deltaproteobacteria bacterium]|nr:hypothetical protein [Deltaproteobacteria bacterium]
MQKTICLLTAFIWISMAQSPAFAADSDLLKELSDMKNRIEELEQQLAGLEAGEDQQASKMEEKIGEELEERFGTLEVHGGAVVYYQGSQVNELNGENADSPSGAGFAADLELAWKPALPLTED